MEVGDTILKEANATLRAAVRNKDFQEVSVVQKRRSVVLREHVQISVGNPIMGNGPD